MEPTIYFYDGEKTVLYDSAKIKGETDALYAMVKPLAETLQTRSITVDTSNYMYDIERYWSNPLTPIKTSVSHPGLPYIDTIVNHTNFDIYFTLNDIEIVIRANQSEKLDLAIGALTFTTKNIKFIPKYELTDYDTVYNLLTKCLRRTLGMNFTTYWNDCINEFMDTDGYGICSDAPDASKNRVCHNIPPFINEKLNMENDHYLLMTDFNKSNFIIWTNNKFISKSRHILSFAEAESGMKHCTYSLSDEQSSFRLKINSNVITYDTLREKWKIFYDDKLTFLVNQFIEMHKHLHPINEFNQVLFPKYILDEKICDVIGDFRKSAFDTKPILWRNYILMSGMIGINNML